MKKPSSLGSPPGKDSPLRDREAYWEKHLQRWRASGLSQGEYSRREGLRPNQLSYWHRRDRRLDAASKPSTTSGFVPVQLSTASESSGLTVKLANGVSIEGIEEPTLELATRLIERL